MEKKKRGEWIEKKKKKREQSGGLDCKWDSTSRFTRKINGAVTGRVPVCVGTSHSGHLTIRLCVCVCDFPV